MMAGRESGEIETRVVLQSSYEDHGVPWDSKKCRIFQGQMEIPHPQIPGENIPVRIGLVWVASRKIKLRGGNTKSGTQLTLAVCFPKQKDYFGFKASHRSYGNFIFHVVVLNAYGNPHASENFMVTAGDGTCLKYFATNQTHQNCLAATFISENFLDGISERELSSLPDKCIQMKSLSGGQFHFIELLVRIRPAFSEASKSEKISTVACRNIRFFKITDRRKYTGIGKDNNQV